MQSKTPNQQQHQVGAHRLLPCFMDGVHSHRGTRGLGDQKKGLKKKNHSQSEHPSDGPPATSPTASRGGFRDRIVSMVR